jgi:chain length determinant protein (polysaccharide antigen chain regulator)
MAKSRSPASKHAHFLNFTIAAPTLSMTSNNTPNPSAENPQDDDEIDLAELVAKLWQGRLIIAGVTALSIAAAGIYAFLAKEEWTSQAVIDTPRLEALGDYYKVQMELRRITGKSTETPEEITQDVFLEFIRQLNSPDFRRQQFSASAYYKQKIQNDKDPSSQRLLLEQMANENFALTPPDGKKTIYNRVQMSAESREGAQALLSSYLNNLNTQVWRTKVSELNVRINTLKLDLSKQMQDLRADADARNRSQLDIAKRANDTASRGKIESFSGSSYQSVPEQDMLFLLGTRSLKARIQTLQDVPPALTASYYQAERKLRELEQLPKLTPSNKHSFRYLEAPTLPITRDKPKRALIVALGAIAGLMLGSLIILGRGAFSSLRSKL